MAKVILKIDGMSCSACSSGLEKHLKSQKGILDASVNLVLAQALIEYNSALISVSGIEKCVSDAGFKSLGIFDEKDEVKSFRWKKVNLLFFGVLVFLLLYIIGTNVSGNSIISWLDSTVNPFSYAYVLLLFAIIFLIYGFDILKSGIKNLRRDMANMDTLVTVGVLASFFYSLYELVIALMGDLTRINNLYFDTVVMVIYFVKLGKFVDSRNKEKTKSAIKELVQITPQTAVKKIDGEEFEVTLDQVKKDDVLVVRPGMKVAADGKVLEGEGYFDESFITGESLPVKKVVGDTVRAGSINCDGYVEYSAKKIGRNSTISEIVRLVVEATNTKTPIARIADEVCKYFVPIVMLIASIAFLSYISLDYTFSEAIKTFVTVLVVACPCALGLATPLAVVISEGLCAKNGLLVKNSKTLEIAHKVDTIVFDKTGTLTTGDLKINRINNYSEYSEKELIKLVASVEKCSSHPFSKTFVKEATERNLSFSRIADFQELPGIGITGKWKEHEVYLGNNKLFKKLKIINKYEEVEEELTSDGNSIVYVIEDRKVIAIIGLSDSIRKSAKEVVFYLKKLGKEIVILTGDNKKTAMLVANELEIDTVKASVMPKEKTNIIKEFQKDNKKVMMVGDGINDAPSLATADIGVSMNSGTDIAGDSADVILINDNLLRVVDLLNISKRTYINIRQNLFWAFFYNCCMIPIAVGLLKSFNIYLTPSLASIAMTISSVTVMLNALRLKRIKIMKESSKNIDVD